jgi:ribose transport system permease protein
MYGILSLAAGILIITGGIDLSMGSVVGLSATVFSLLLMRWECPLPFAVPIVLLLGVVIGLFHGLLVTKVKVQAFIVTLCGLFLYRGVARWIADDSVVGLRDFFLDVQGFWNGAFLGVSTYFWFLLAFLAVAGVFLHGSAYGRYLFAIGSNEKAARYAGIAVDRYKIFAYVLSSSLAALFGMLHVMRTNSVQPSETGNFMELYAIAGAVLGGCSLRGGDGNVLGILVGTCIMWLLPNLTSMWRIPSSLEYTVIGAALLVGAVMDEVLRSRAARKG